MSFAAASGLWLTAIALPVVALYILKVRRHRRTVPYLELWQKLVAERQITTLFRKLQRLFSLLLQLLIALCLVLAFASLTLSTSFLVEESVVLIVDTSASMTGRATAAGDTGSRLDAAVRQARDLVEGRSAEDHYAVLAAGAEPEVLQGFSQSTLRLREALDRVQPTKAIGDLAAAHRLARDLLRDREHPRILLLSDAAAGVAAELAASDEDLVWLPVGETVDNLAILRFQARKNHAVGTDYLLLVVANYGSERAQAQVEIELQGKLRKVLPVDLEPGAEFSEVLPVTVPEGGFATARIVHPEIDAGTPAARPGVDGLALDDVAYAAIPASRLFSVLLVSTDVGVGAPFRAALSELGRLGDMVDAETSYAVTFQEWNDFDGARREQFDLVVFVHSSPMGTQFDVPEQGHYLCIFALPRGMPARSVVEESMPRIQFRGDHALTRFLEARSMRPWRARPLDLTGGEVFMETEAGPVGVVFQEPERTVVYLGVDMLSDHFYLGYAFPILIRNALGWMHEQENELLEPTYRPGAAIRPRFALTDDTVRVGFRHADGASGQVDVPLRDGRFVYRKTAEPGHYWVQTADAGYRTTVNLFSAAEGDLALPADRADQELGIESSGFLFGRDLWPILLLAALALWALEWGLFHRRITE